MLIKSHIRRLPVDVYRIAKRYKIAVCKNSDIRILGPGERGISISHSGKWTVVYDDRPSKYETNYIIACEIGKILLGYQVQLASGHDRIIVANVTSAADNFARELLMPGVVLWGTGLHTPSQIKQYCNVPLEIATMQAEEMITRYKRDDFGDAIRERQVFSRFAKFMIKECKKMKEK